jgi:hypothetical protein
MRKREYIKNHLNLIRIFLMLFFLVFTNYSDGQVKNKKWYSLKFGAFNIGYRDTVIFDTTENYSFKNLNIKKPYFIHIWYPCEVTQKKSLSFYYRDYWKFEKDSTNSKLISNIMKIYYEQTFGSSEIPPEIANTIVNVQKNAAKLPGDFDVVIYYHGSQGVGIENSKLCEFLASHGFIVISPNFTLPSDLVSKLIPSTNFKSKFDLNKLSPEIMENIQVEMNISEMRNLDFILKFVRQFSTNNKILGIGHSRGAQRLLLSDRDSINRLDKIITLHTTYEEDDIEEICSIRPFDCSLIDGNEIFFTTQKFIFAPKYYMNDTLKSPDFTFYDKFKNSSYIEINTPIEHNAFVYDWLLYNTKKGTVALNRIPEYNRILNLCLDIIKENKIQTNKFIKLSTNK